MKYMLSRFKCPWRCWSPLKPISQWTFIYFYINGQPFYINCCTRCPLSSHSCPGTIWDDRKESEGYHPKHFPMIGAFHSALSCSCWPPKSRNHSYSHVKGRPYWHSSKPTADETVYHRNAEWMLGFDIVKRGRVLGSLSLWVYFCCLYVRGLMLYGSGSLYVLDNSAAVCYRTLRWIWMQLLKPQPCRVYCGNRCRTVIKNECHFSFQ